MELPGQMDLLPALDAILAEQTARGNGGPPLDEAPSFEALARIGRSAYGRLWEGKVASAVGEDPRTLRRWRAGQGAPTARTLAWARDWALDTAADLLSAAGERDLADAVRSRRADLRRRAAEAGCAVHAAHRKVGSHDRSSSSGIG